MHALEYVPFVVQPKQLVQRGLGENQLAQLLGAEVRVDAASRDDSAPPSVAEQVKALLDEQLVEIDVRPHPLAVDDADLIPVLRRRAVEGADVGEVAEVLQPGRA